MKTKQVVTGPVPQSHLPFSPGIVSGEYLFVSGQASVDDQGQIIPEARAPNFLNLPLVVGEGANEQAAAILELMNARPGLMQKTYALVRVDTRRWDIHLKNGTIVKLPALNQDDAMARLDALITERRVLDQGFAEIDLLDPTALQVVPLVSRPTPQT